MKPQTMGSMIAKLRKDMGMTQMELAEKMGVTDKAVSKWERDLSLPDITAIPRLAEIFHIRVEELMQGEEEKEEQKSEKNRSKMLQLVLKSVALAMGVAVVVLSLLNQIEVKEAIGMLGTGVACLAAERLSSGDCS